MAQEPARNRGRVASTRARAKMLRELPGGTKRVIEPAAARSVHEGTDRQGHRARRLLVIELNQTLFQHLRQRFRVSASRAQMRRTLRAWRNRPAYLDSAPADGVISGLGMLSMSSRCRGRSLSAAFSVLAPTGASPVHLRTDQPVSRSAARARAVEPPRRLQRSGTCRRDSVRLRARPLEAGAPVKATPR